MNAMQLYFQIVKTLDEINAPYMVVGAFAARTFGSTRNTVDVDMLVDLNDA